MKAKRLLTLPGLSLLGLFITLFGLAQTAGDYRSFQSGDWNNAARGERYDWGLINPAPTPPMAVDGAVAILSGHTNTNTVTDSTSGLRAEFIALARAWMRAYNSGDSATLEAMYAPDAEYISGHVKGLVAKGRARLIANFQNGVRMGGHIDSISVLSIHSDCDLATLLCEYEATNSGQKAIGRTLLVMKKIDEKWRIVLHMTVV